MPTSNYDPSAYQEAGANHWYLSQVDKDGSALAGGADAFGHMQIKLTSAFSDSQPNNPVYADDKQEFTSIPGQRTISLMFEVGQDDSTTQALLQNALGKYYAVVNMVGVDSYNNTSSLNQMKIEYFPICKLDAVYERNTPDGRKPKFTFRPIKNPTASALTLTNVGTITGALTTADADNNLDSTAWDALDFSVAPGKYQDTQVCILAS